MKKKDINYRMMEHDDCENIVRFLNECSNNITIEDWMWYVYQNPYGESRVYLSETVEKEIVGVHGYSPTKICINENEYNATIGHSLAIKEKYRNIISYLNLMKYSLDMERSAGSDFCIGPPNNNAYEAHKRLTRWFDFGHLDLMSIRNKKPKSLTRVERCVKFKNFSTEFDTLNKEIFDRHKFYFVSDLSRMNWRYSQRPSADYTIYGYLEGERLNGYMIIKQWKDEKGYVTAHIMELQALNAKAIECLLGEAYLYASDCDEIDIWSVGGSPYLELLKKEGFQCKLRRPITIKPLSQKFSDKSLLNFPVNGPASFMFGDIDTY
jgi:hypothetical protein